MHPHAKQLHYYCNKTSNKSILNVALDVHMVYTGAMDYHEDYLKDVSLLLWARDNWYESHNSLNKQFSQKVYELIEQALEDHKKFVCNVGRGYFDLSVLDDPEYFRREA